MASFVTGVGWAGGTGQVAGSPVGRGVPTEVPKLQAAPPGVAQISAPGQENDTARPLMGFFSLASLLQGS